MHAKEAWNEMQGAVEMESMAGSLVWVYRQMEGFYFSFHFYLLDNLGTIHWSLVNLVLQISSPNDNFDVPVWRMDACPSSPPHESRTPQPERGMIVAFPKAMAIDLLSERHLDDLLQCSLASPPNVNGLIITVPRTVVSITVPDQ